MLLATRSGLALSAFAVLVGLATVAGCAAPGDAADVGGTQGSAAAEKATTRTVKATPGSALADLAGLTVVYGADVRWKLFELTASGTLGNDKRLVLIADEGARIWELEGTHFSVQTEDGAVQKQAGKLVIEVVRNAPDADGVQPEVDRLSIEYTGNSGALGERLSVTSAAGTKSVSASTSANLAALAHVSSIQKPLVGDDLEARVVQLRGDAEVETIGLWVAVRAGKDRAAFDLGTRVNDVNDVRALSVDRFAIGGATGPRDAEKGVTLVAEIAADAKSLALTER